MASKLIGSWELQSDENINEYLKLIGMALVKRKVAITMKPIISISKNDDLWCISIDMKTKGTETLFKEDQEVDTSNEMKFVFDQRFYFDSRRKCKSNFKFVNPDKLVQKTDFQLTEEQLIITREVNADGSLIETLEMNGVVARRFFKRIA